MAEGGVPADAALEESAPAPAVPGELLPPQLLAVLQADLRRTYDSSGSLCLFVCLCFCLFVADPGVQGAVEGVAGGVAHGDLALDVGLWVCQVLPGSQTGHVLRGCPEVMMPYFAVS